MSRAFLPGVHIRLTLRQEARGVQKNSTRRITFKQARSVYLIFNLRQWNIHHRGKEVMSDE